MNVTLPLHQHAQRQPNKPALVSERIGLTYRELDHAVWRGAAHFHAAGLRPGDRVANAVLHPLVRMASGLALARLGVASFSVAPGEGPLMIDTMVQRIDARAVISQSRNLEIHRCPQILVNVADLSASGKIPPGLMSEDPDLIWGFVTSSGTTGKPKLFAGSHARWMSIVPQLQLAIPSAASDVLFSIPPPHFIAGMAHNLHALTCGGTVVIPVSQEWEPIFGLMARAGVNRVFAVPSLLTNLLRSPGAPAVLSQVSVLTVSGSVVSRALREAALKLTPGLLVLYGCNEMGALASTRGMHSLGLADTVGFPIPYGELEIVDDAGRSLAPGLVGQIRVRQDTMISSYFDDPLADERFFKGGWFHPGDLAGWSDDGQVVFKGRADDLMIFNGINIYPAEIESSLQEHPSVREAFSFPLPSDRHGELPVAAVRVNADVSEAELIGFCRERLGARHPRKVMIVDDFPRNRMGKPLKHELAQMMMKARD